MSYLGPKLILVIHCIQELSREGDGVCAANTPTQFAQTMKLMAVYPAALGDRRPRYV